MELAKEIKRKRCEICAEVEAQEITRLFPRGASAAVAKAVKDTFRMIGEKKRNDDGQQQKIVGESDDHVNDSGILPTGARGAGSSSAGADGVTGTEGHDSEREQGAEAARAPWTANEFVRAVFRFCRVL